jgi:hypothetical protein
MDDDQGREEWERVIRSLGAGYLVRWDQHDHEALEEEVGPMTRQRAEEHDLAHAWFG